MSEYRSRDPYKSLKHYRNVLNHYRRRKPYSIHYRNPVKIKVYYKPPPAARRARGRLEYPKLRPENVKPPEKKYESKHRTERTSAPPIPRPLRYTSGSQVEPWVDAEEIVKEVENSLDKKITERMLEKFESEFEEVMNKFADRLSEKTAETTEEKVETSKQDLIGNTEETIEQAEKPETEQEIPERVRETGEDYTNLEGGFSISSTFGLVIPLEDQEIEDKTEPLENVEGETRHHGETIEVEGENEAQVEHPQVETEGMEFGTAGIEETEVVKEGMIEEQDRIAPEPLPEETELYPIEKMEIF